MIHPDPRIAALLSSLAHPNLAEIDLSLDRMRALLRALGNPEERLPPVIHVAGTNGKGSLLAYLTAIFDAAGYRVHRYTSPELVRFNERILLAGGEIGDELLLECLKRVAEATRRVPVTAFEAATAAAFLAFGQIPADVLLLETGLGGRLDATNVVARPILTAITPISFDHMDYLGTTLPAIAAEKAGILKPGVPCVVGPQLTECAMVIERRANEIGASLYRYGNEWRSEPKPGGFLYVSAQHHELFPAPSLPGDHQMDNAATAIACCELLSRFRIAPPQMARGIEAAIWPARLQRLVRGRLADMLPDGAELWLDGAHNPAAAQALARWLGTWEKPVHLIGAMLRTKDACGFLAQLSRHTRSFTAIPMATLSGERSDGMLAEELARIGTEVGIKSRIEPDVKSAIKAIVKNEENDFIILICGSLYLAGNILWQNSQRP